MNKNESTPNEVAVRILKSHCAKDLWCYLGSSLELFTDIRRIVNNPEHICIKYERNFLCQVELEIFNMLKMIEMKKAA